MTSLYLSVNYCIDIHAHHNHFDDSVGLWLPFYILLGIHLRTGSWFCRTKEVPEWSINLHTHLFFQMDRNRDMALERLHQTERAQVDYWHAFTIDPSMVRIRAGIEEIELLIELDEAGAKDVRPDSGQFALSVIHARLPLFLWRAYTIRHDKQAQQRGHYRYYSRYEEGLCHAGSEGVA